MINLLKETKKAIRHSGHKISDIVHIGNDEYGCTWEKFSDIADQEYICGYGAQKVAKDLTIVFKDGSTMWRGEHDGSEWWEYSKPFKVPVTYKSIKELVGDMWNSIEDLNAE